MQAFVKKHDFWSGMALAALGAYILRQALGWTYMDQDGPGPGFFPRWYGSAMLLLSVLLVAGAVLKPGTGAPQKGLVWAELRRALGGWLALVACIAMLKFVGFIIGFALLTWFMVTVLYRRPQRVALPLAVGGALGFHALFVWALELRLPVWTLT